VSEEGDGRLDLGAALDRAFTGRWSSGLGLQVGHDSGLLPVFAASPGTAAEVAQRAGSDPRMTEAWLRVMVLAGFAEHADGVFTPAPGLDEFAGDGSPETQAGAFAAMMARDARLMPRLAEALRHGGGVPHDVYEPEGSLAQDVLNAESVEHELVPKVLGVVPGLAERLTAGADVLDLGCGSGRAVVVMARAFPASRFTGYDLSSEAIGRAREKAAAAGVAARFEERDATDVARGSFDAVMAFDTVHDIGAPMDTLVAAREGLREGGLFIMVEADASGDFETDRHGDQAWQFFTSFASCVPRNLATGGPGLGSMWGRAGWLPMLAEAGFADVAVHGTEVGALVFACTT
jgi:SAM-dependent methyltransferase